ncbi:hypothetical protein CTAYLR_000633 [Chrysophaeum taylorii]|uniref:EF-hand domain-containing protein n=1 Tax=Chrysophaeum taylorii TaxID=2483200 RepID=A0AAD7UAZ6_9STRA|nr:hypothetical protein CTAYLR_000633 [Chrysophaeum taylorii]
MFGSQIESHKYYGALARRSRETDARSLFPEVGDTVIVRHALCWRRAKVLKVKECRRRRRTLYDLHLENDGEWTPEEVKKFRRLFRSYDTDNSGTVDLEELKAMFEDLGGIREDVEDVFRRVDKDGSGTVSFAEFCDLVYVQLGGIFHYVMDVPRSKLLLRPEKKEDIFELRAQPFKDIFAERDRAINRRRARRARARLAALSHPRRTAVYTKEKKK